MSQHIHCVEDDPAIRKMLLYALSREGYDLSESENCRDADHAIKSKMPDLLLVDWMLPDLSGPEWIKRLRTQSHFEHTPIIMLTAKSEEEDTIYGLDSGADDYLIKPISIQLLLARIKAQLRRYQSHQPMPQNIFEDAQFVLDQAKQTISAGSRNISLAGTEARLLSQLMSCPGQVLNRQQLLDQAWGENSFLEERTVDVSIVRLRKALKKIGVRDCIKTVRGLGYTFEAKDV